MGCFIDDLKRSNEATLFIWSNYLLLLGSTAGKDAGFL